MVEMTLVYLVMTNWSHEKNYGTPQAKLYGFVLEW